MMHDLKVGDVVIRNAGWHGSMEVGHTDTIVDLPLNKSVTLAKYGKGHSRRNLGILLAADDPLPPVPDSVLYFNSETYGDRKNDQRLLVGVGTEFTSSGNIFVGCKPRTDRELAAFRGCEHGIGINLDPDSALQLAHDLTRMALKLKRKQEKD